MTRRKPVRRVTVQDMVVVTLEIVLLYPRIACEWLRVRCLFYGIKALMFVFNGEEWVLESDQNLLVSRRLHRSYECFAFREKQRLKKGHAFIYLGDWKL